MLYRSHILLRGRELVGPMHAAYVDQEIPWIQFSAWRRHVHVCVLRVRTSMCVCAWACACMRAALVRQQPRTAVAFRWLRARTVNQAMGPGKGAILKPTVFDSNIFSQTAPFSLRRNVGNHPPWLVRRPRCGRCASNGFSGTPRLPRRLSWLPRRVCSRQRGGLFAPYGGPASLPMPCRTGLSPKIPRANWRITERLWRQFYEF